MVQNTLAPIPTHSITQYDKDTIWLFLNGFNRERTVTGYAFDINQLLLFVNFKSLNDIDLMDLRRYQLSLAHLKPNIIHRKLSAIRQLFKFAKEQERIDHNYAISLKSPSVATHV
jgi:site-specific recombinase XerD